MSASRGWVVSEADMVWLMMHTTQPVAYAFGSHVWLSPNQPEAEALLQQHWWDEYVKGYQ